MKFLTWSRLYSTSTLAIIFEYKVHTFGKPWRVTERYCFTLFSRAFEAFNLLFPVMFPVVGGLSFNGKHDISGAAMNNLNVTRVS